MRCCSTCLRNSCQRAIPARTECASKQRSPPEKELSPLIRTTRQRMICWQYCFSGRIIRSWRLSRRRPPWRLIPTIRTPCIRTSWLAGALATRVGTKNSRRGLRKRVRRTVEGSSAPIDTACRKSLILKARSGQNIASTRFTRKPEVRLRGTDSVLPPGKGTNYWIGSRETPFSSLVWTKHSLRVHCAL